MCGKNLQLCPTASLFHVAQSVIGMQISGTHSSRFSYLVSSPSCLLTSSHICQLFQLLEICSDLAEADNHFLETVLHRDSSKVLI